MPITVADLAAIATAVVVTFGGLWALFRFVFLAPLRASIDALTGRVGTVIDLLGTHTHHPETGKVVAPIRGGGDGDD
jgi:hypothetical protein